MQISGISTYPITLKAYSLFLSFKEDNGFSQMREDAKNAKENQDHYIGLIFAFVAPLRENKLD